MGNRVRDVDPIIESTYAGFPFFTSSATTNTSGMLMPAALRAEVAYFRVAEVHIAHFGLGNEWLDASCERRECKHLPSKEKAKNTTTHIFHDGVNAREFDYSTMASSAFNNRHLEYFCLTLRHMPFEPPEMTRWIIVPTLSSSGSSIPQYLRRLSAVLTP